MKVHCKFDQMVQVSELKAHPKNRNTHPPDQIERLAQILKYQGWRCPIKVSKRSGYITSGHGRLMAAHQNGWNGVPVNYQDYETDEQEYADLIADNSVASWAELDLKAINMDLADLGPDFNIDLLGIKDFTLDLFEKLDPQCDEDEIPEKVEPRTKLGDIYQLGRHRLMCGDSTQLSDIQKLMNSELADLWLTDPPYGVNYESENSNIKLKKIQNDSLPIEEMSLFWRDVATSALMAVKDKSSYYWFACQGGDQMMMMMLLLGEAGWAVRHELIWVKSKFVFGRSDYHYRHEPILYGWKKKGTHEWYADRKQDSVLEFDKPNSSDLHTTTKPVELLEYLIGNSTAMGGLVLDTFGGSGSTLIACEKSNRKAFLMEIEPHFCDVIVTRWELYTGKKAELLTLVDPIPESDTLGLSL